jgi:hypothetical protein
MDVPLDVNAKLQVGHASGRSILGNTGAL